MLYLSLLLQRISTQYVQFNYCLALPEAGKGTQSEKLIEKYGLKHLSHRRLIAI